MYLFSLEVRDRRLIAASFTRSALDAKVPESLGSDDGGGNCTLEEVGTDGWDANWRVDQRGRRS